MSEAKHTPGPWIWADDYRGLYGAGPDSAVLEHASYEGMWVSHGDKRDANARLIAAAPELLEALDEIANHGDAWTHEGLVMIARDAIAKATGEQQ